MNEASAPEIGQEVPIDSLAWAYVVTIPNRPGHFYTMWDRIVRVCYRWKTPQEPDTEKWIVTHDDAERIQEWTKVKVNGISGFNIV